VGIGKVCGDLWLLSLEDRRRTAAAELNTSWLETGWIQSEFGSEKRRCKSIWGSGIETINGRHLQEDEKLTLGSRHLSDGKAMTVELYCWLSVDECDAAVSVLRIFVDFERRRA
jgi:hypothetical protein